MEQGPYEFQRTRSRLHRSQRVRRRTENSATQPFLASKNLNQVTAAAHCGCNCALSRGLFFAAKFWAAIRRAFFEIRCPQMGDRMAEEKEGQGQGHKYDARSEEHTS